MTGKIKLYVGLLTLGLVVIGGGIWMLVDAPPKINIPKNSPVIVMNAGRLMAGARSYLAIYEDGTVINIEESGLRPQGAKAIRVWKTGHLQQEELSGLVQLFKDKANELKETYRFPCIKNQDGSTSSGDLDLTIVINYQDFKKMVRAGGYLSPQSSLFYVLYPDMPSPLNEIYSRLKNIAENHTEEVYRENI